MGWDVSSATMMMLRNSHLPREEVGVSGALYGVAEGGRTPLLAWLQWHGQAWLGWRAAGEALITGSCSFALFRGRG